MTDSYYGPSDPNPQPPAQQPAPPPQYYPPQPGYPPQAYYPPQPYYAPQPVYPGYGAYVAPAPDPNGRPGFVVATAVLSFVDAGLLIVAAIFVFFGASIVGTFDDSGTSGELGVDGFVNLTSAGLLIAGGVMVMMRKELGRLLLSVGAGLTIASGIYWPIRFGGGFIFLDLLLTAPSILAVVFIWLTPVTGWLRRANTA